MSQVPPTFAISLRPATAGGDYVAHIVCYGAKDGGPYGSQWYRNLDVGAATGATPRDVLLALAAALIERVG